MTDLFAASEATWPAARLHKAGAFTVREGEEGGQRVSCATADAPWTATDIDAAEAMHRQLGQTLLFMIREGEAELDAALDRRGYAIKDPVNLYEGSTAALAADPVPPMAAFTVWPPLAIMRDIWAEGGIGPARLAVMARVGGPKTAVLGRVRDRASGVAFIAAYGDVAVLHALHMVPEQRRQGSAVQMMRKAAHWAQDQGITRFCVLVTKANGPANALYASLGMRIVGQYHYRSKQTPRGKGSS